MLRTFTAAALVLLALGTSARAQVTALAEPQHPALKSEAIVTGNVVRIGDLIANAGIVADVPIFRAPDLGGTGTITVARVLDAVRPHALVGLDPGGLTEISVTRASRTVPGADVEAAISAAIAARYSLGPSKELTLYLDRPLRGIHVEPTGTTAPRVDRLNYDPRSGKFEAAIEIAGPPVQQLRVVGVAIVTAPVVTLTRALGRGELIKPGDVTIERRPRSEIGADTLSDVQSAIGLAARAPLSGGRLLRSAELMKPELISRNDTVTLVYEIPGVTVTARGKAMEAGAEGDVIEVATQHTKRTVHGVVVASGRVVIAHTAPRAVARAEPRAPSATPVSAQKRTQ
jgi:flagella basal body P-ring formation protein FlgA